MKLLFLFVVLSGLSKPNFSLYQTESERARVASGTQAGCETVTDAGEGITVDAENDPESVAALLFAKLKTELDKQTAAMIRINYIVADIQKRITNAESKMDVYNVYISRAIDDNYWRHEATKRMIGMESKKTEDGFLELKEILFDVKETLNYSINSQEPKNLQDLINQNMACELSKGLDMTLLSNGNQYYFERTKISWHKVKEFCEQHGMTMVSLDTDKEFEAVSSHYPDLDYWLSANDIGREPGNFYWANGAQLDISRWSNRRAFGRGKETCLDLRNKQMRDWPCTDGGSVLCKRPAYCKVN